MNLFGVGSVINGAYPDKFLNSKLNLKDIIGLHENIYQTRQIDGKGPDDKSPSTN